MSTGVVSASELRVVEEHGTIKGYATHRRKHTVPCRPCLRAENRRKLAYTRARHAAYAELRARHPQEYAELLAEHVEREAARVQPD